MTMYNKLYFGHSSDWLAEIELYFVRKPYIFFSGWLAEIELYFVRKPYLLFSGWLTEIECILWEVMLIFQ